MDQADRRQQMKHHFKLHNLSRFIPLDHRGETRTRLKLLPIESKRQARALSGEGNGKSNELPRGSVTSVRFEALLDKLVAVQWGLEPVCGVSMERAQVVASLGAIAGACHVLRSAIADVRNIICEADGLTTMGRIYAFRASGEAERAEPSDETVSGASSDAHR